MADIIDFNSPKESQTTKPQPDKKPLMINALFEEILKNKKHIKDTIVFINTKDGDRLMYHSDCSLEDKCVFLQVLQSDINNDLNQHDEDLDDLDFDE